MYTLARRLASVATAAALLAAPASAQDWGSLKGRFVFDGPAPVAKKIDIGGKDAPVCGKCALAEEELVIDPATKGIKNVVVYLIAEDAKIHPDYEKLAETPVVLDNKCCRFEPHIATLWVKQPLKITNSDACGHNAACSPKKDEPFNPLLQPNTDTTVKFQASQTLPQPVTCSIHPWMKGYILPRATPYVVATNDKGEFEIKNLPAGEHKFQIWHERSGYLVAKKEWVDGRKKGVATLTITGGSTTDLGDVKVDPALVAPK